LSNCVIEIPQQVTASFSITQFQITQLLNDVILVIGGQGLRGSDSGVVWRWK
jgi:hypothetical protein